MANSSTPDCTMHLHEDHTSMGEEIGQIGQLIDKYLQMKATSGWQSIHPISKELLDSQIGLMVIAFKLDYETTADPATGYIKRHDKRAVLFTWTERISYDFVKNEFKVSRDHIKEPLDSLGGVGHGKERLCILWADFHGKAARIYCTTFDVHVIDQQPRAVNVSTNVYNVKGSHLNELDAVHVGNIKASGVRARVAKPRHAKARREKLDVRATGFLEFC
ncbi:unnamed protein product [Cuscuta campestris]|uniref:Uncharacterized protein n=1 Tax=Cuscuta campestris TaxID=132261 RepID=A0A484MQ30_9ASTE|nr:unnamed protein product [Cuscuta campestris]